MTPFIEQYYEKSIRIAPDGFSFFKLNGKKMESVIMKGLKTETQEKQLWWRPLWLDLDIWGEEKSTYP